MRKQFQHILTTISIAAIGMHLTNRIIDKASSAKHILKTDKGHIFKWKYGDVFYTVEGSGQPLLLIHQLSPECSGLEWKQVQHQLAKNYTVYTLDLPGCGRSEKPNQIYTNFLYVQLLNDFKKTIITKPAILIATGDSCSFSIMAANMEPDNFSKLCLINPPSLKDMTKGPDQTRNFIRNVLSLPVLGTFIYNMKMCYLSMESKVSQDKNHPYVTNQDLIDGYYEAAHMDHSRGKFLLSSKISNYTNIQIDYALRKIKPEVILINSSQKKGIYELERTYKMHRPTIKVFHVSNSATSPQLDAPQQLLTTLNNIIS